MSPNKKTTLWKLKPFNIINSTRLDRHKKSRDKQKIKMLSWLKRSSAMSSKYIMESIIDISTSSHWNLSQAITHDLLNNNDKIDWIEYVDLKQHKSYNFALKPSAADRLILEKVYVWILEGSEFKCCKTWKLIADTIKYSDYISSDNPFRQEWVRYFSDQ